MKYHPNISELFSDLNERLYDLTQYNKKKFELGATKGFVDYEELYIEKIKKGIFLFPPNDGISMIESYIRRIERLQRNEYSLVENLTFYRLDSKQIGEEEIERERILYTCEIETELSVYWCNLHELKEDLLAAEEYSKTYNYTDEVTILPKKEKVKSTLTVPQIAVLIRILNEYDPAGLKRVMPKYGPGEITKLCNIIVNSFSSLRMSDISANSIQSKYYSSEELEAVDYWVDKLRELRIGALNLRQDMKEM